MEAYVIRDRWLTNRACRLGVADHSGIGTGSCKADELAGHGTLVSLSIEWQPIGISHFSYILLDPAGLRGNLASARRPSVHALPQVPFGTRAIVRDGEFSKDKHDLGNIKSTGSCRPKRKAAIST